MPKIRLTWFVEDLGLTFETLNKFEVYDASGRFILQTDSHLNAINLNSLPAGIYFLRAETLTKFYNFRYIKINWVLLPGI